MIRLVIKEEQGYMAMVVLELVVWFQALKICVINIWSSYSIGRQTGQSFFKQSEQSSSV